MYGTNTVRVLATVPEDAEDGAGLTLTGGYTVPGTGFGSGAGGHRDAGDVVPPNLDADDSISGAFNIFPDLTVTVGAETEYVAVNNITLNRDKLHLSVGSNYTLKATVSPSDATEAAVTWTSSDESVAQVVDGLVTGESNGTATITASAGGKSVSIVVTVGTGGSTGGDDGSGDDDTTADLDFGLTEDEIVGYVTVSFEDNGIRVEGESIDELYENPLGTIIEPVEVPFKAYDTIASVTLRLLEAKGITASYSGNEYGGFYLSSIGNFQVNGVTYSQFGEFSAGQGSGWMITWNKGGNDRDWFIDKGASEFYVTEGDIIKWQYTCQLGADIGDTYTTEAIENVEQLIAAIGTVTADSKEAIESARAAYEELNDFQKNQVSNYDLLEAAEKAYAELIATEADKAAADKVEGLIKNIGTVTLDSEKAIAGAREAYDALTDTQKYLVKNYETLVTAENRLKQLNGLSYKEVYKITGDYLEGLADKTAPTVNSVGGEWLVLGLTRSGRDLPEGYYDNVAAYVKENINAAGQLHTSKSTDNSRVILALTAAGIDPTNVEGYNLLTGLTDMDYVEKQGINGPIWALIALDSHAYKVPETTAENPVTREKLINAILNAQLEDHGWAITKDGSADADMTAMAIQALAPYYKSNADVKDAVDDALEKLSDMQNADGSFSATQTDGTYIPTSESTAQVVVALTALGINPEEDSRFIKNGSSAVAALCSFAVDGGGFEHTADGGFDGMASEQGYYALTAYMRLLDKKTSLYDMTDVTLKTGTVTPDDDKKDDDSTTSGGSTTDKDTDDTTEDTLTADEKAAQKVEKLIDAIGTVTVKSETRIKRARAAYDALTSAQKKLVSNYKTLLIAEVDLNLAKVEYVEDLIDSIGEVTASTSSKKKISRARTAYNKLDEELQAEVMNYDVLLAAEAAYKQLTASGTKKTTTTSGTKTTASTGKDLTKYAITVEEMLAGITADSLTGEMVDAILSYEELTEEEKAAINKENLVKELKERVAEGNQTDSKTGIAVSGCEWNIRLVVEDVVNVSKMNLLEEALGANKMLGLWDIYLEDIITGERYETTDTVLVKIPVELLGDYSSFDGLAIVHYTEDGKAEYLDCREMGGYLVFNTVEFSCYAAVGYMGESPVAGALAEVTDTSADNAWLPWVIAGAFGLAVTVLLLMMMKKNKKEEQAE